MPNRSARSEQQLSDYFHFFLRLGSRETNRTTFFFSFELQQQQKRQQIIIVSRISCVLNCMNHDLAIYTFAVQFHISKECTPKTINIKQKRAHARDAIERR